MTKVAQQMLAGQRFAEAEGCHHPAHVVVLTGDEELRQLRMHLQIGMPDPIHTHHPPCILGIEIPDPGNRDHAHEEDDRQEEERGGEEHGVEPASLGDEGKCDHGS